jgi:hypothetical protein
MRPLLATAAALALTAALGPGAATSVAADCSVYPGDDAPKATLAIWMADGALRRGVPPELPVMGALVESGLKNLKFGDADSVGFFLMRVGIWNRGEYAGFPDDPSLQLKWFLDTALAVKAARLAAGDSAFGADEARYGDWAADVLRPAEQYRGRYQPRLAEARALIGAGCPMTGPGPGLGPGSPSAPQPPPSSPGPSSDTRPPALRLPRPGLTRGARGIAVRLACDETCVARATVLVPIPGASRTYRISSRPRTLAPGASARVTLRFGPRLRRALARQRRRGRRVTATLRVTARDAAGNASSRRARLVLSR